MSTNFNNDGFNTELSEATIGKLRDDFSLLLTQVKVEADLEMLKRDWSGKEGVVKLFFQKLREVPAEDKPKIAQALNAFKQLVEEGIASREKAFIDAIKVGKLASESIDLSLPTASPGLGAIHPVTLVEDRITEILKPFGFQNINGPEIEQEYYCFDALNIPKHHPARDMQDTFYVDLGAASNGDQTVGHALRTHTTSVQARVLQQRSLFEGKKLPIKVSSLGRVYRNENEDASHQAMFHQYELVWIEEGLTVANLIGLITHILKELYGKRRKVRFVPKFYPYTEPSLGPQIDCTVCRGAGCSSCGGAGWVTIGGSGMVHSKVLKEFGFDPEKVSGFAFGLGTSRLAGQMYNFTHLRSVYENDLRILQELA